MSDSALIFLSCGGTGGHMTPAQALANDLMSRGFKVEVITDSRGLKFQEIFKNIPMNVVRSGTVASGVLGKVQGLANLALGIVQAVRIIRARKPAMVVGFGGYPSVPGVMAAQILGIPTIIHEQNAVIGRANAFLAGKATRIALSLPEVQGLDEAERQRCVFTGNPVRPEISALYSLPYPHADENGPLRIFIMGGSLGASVFSQIVPKALGALSADHRGRLKIVQQCREGDLAATQKAYEESGIQAELATFFNNVSEQLAQAHLVIARSGASTVAEVATAGRPAIFVPYPHHKDQQQKMNADAIADVGGAWVMTESGFTVDALRARIETFLQSPGVLFSAAEKARSCGRPDAARKLGNLVTALVSGWNE
jgi:UDP-N-acetylglucosamine--N-acetylmuramyl-(pentapeptide) pyrophosphoryl-undecaprenol N-acetylglucosamine transferase